MQEVEVPQALGPEAMKELVSKVNENQTAALIELISLLSTPTDKNQTLPADGVLCGEVTSFDISRA